MPFVVKLIADNRRDGKKTEEVTTNPTLERIIETVRELDGKNRTLVWLEGNNRVFAIGGGNDGRLCAQIIVGANKEFYTLIDPSKGSDRDIQIVTGHQLGVFPENQCVDLDSSIEAVRVFYNSGEPSSALEWARE